MFARLKLGWRGKPRRRYLSEATHEIRHQHMRHGTHHQPHHALYTGHRAHHVTSKALEGLDEFDTGAHTAVGHTLPLLPAHAEHPASSPQIAIVAQRDTPETFPDAEAIIPIEDFIRCVQEVERAYLADSPDQIVTRLRMLYYSGPGFRQLIRRVVAPRNNARIPREIYRRLTARANENGLRDNPSPYIRGPRGQEIDIGHALLGLDALLHPGSGMPYDAYGVPTIDAASWVADVGFASSWMTLHEQTGRPGSYAHRRLSCPNLDAYYEMSAPIADLLGDADAFGLWWQWERGCLSFSRVLHDYYLAPGIGSGVTRRWRIFCTTNNFGYSWDGREITWDDDLRDHVIRRLNMFCDLVGAGNWGALARSLLRTPRRRYWPYTPAVADRFLQWVKTQLDDELMVQ